MVVFFGDKANAEVLASLEGIDDDLDGHEIPFVMSDDANMAGEFDIETFPAVVAFQASIFCTYRVMCAGKMYLKMAYTVVQLLEVAAISQQLLAIGILPTRYYYILVHVPICFILIRLSASR